MRFISMIGGLGALVTVVATSYVNAITIVDFEDWTAPGSLTWSASSRGFHFISEGPMQIMADPPDGSQNGTLSLRTLTENNVTMSKAEGSTFNLLKADFGEGTTEWPSTCVIVTGFFVGGGSISFTAPLDGVLPLFETIEFSGFTNLISARFEGDSPVGFSVDNIVVPEPTTVCALVVGGMAAMRRRRRGFGDRLALFALAGLVLLTGTGPVRAEWTAGPVVIGGDDTDDHFPQRGEYYIREGFTFLGSHVTNGNTIAVCIGCNGGQASSAFNTAFDASHLVDLNPP